MRDVLEKKGFVKEIMIVGGWEELIGEVGVELRERVLF